METSVAEFKVLGSQFNVVYTVFAASHRYFAALFGATKSILFYLDSLLKTSSLVLLDPCVPDICASQTVMSLRAVSDSDVAAKL